MKITPFDSVKKFLSIDIVKCQHYSDLRPLEGKAISYFIRLHNIPEKCKQCNKMYHKGIPFAEHNFRPFQDIFFVIYSLVRITIQNTI
jgi:hypothetical protein